MAKRTKKKKSSTKESRSLSRFQQSWEGREAWSGGGWKPPIANDQVARIVTSIITTSQAGDEQVDWTFVMVEPEALEGKEFHDYQQFDPPQKLNYIEGRLAVLGVKADDDINKLGEALQEADGLLVRFDCYNEEFHNIRITDVLEEDGSDDETKEPELTAKQVKDMSEDELTALAADHNLSPDDYATWEDLAEEIIAVAELK